ncbi:MAG: hypothetical protein AUJ92_04530 [Armatimonadetes bacterium CG2_30_59_28]|nr:discoidin domain-containing protein [Armatimonadota bacterium]OIO96993.1 MAG: hypothetical protein AUJ92_04530 [Armatimonadetes bacterium CG2_30_59_28]PIU64230.1 MAG: hypothetical protein COS85_13230 [Armatimonadetes bacterium CG07_land_8_20_14_0_80_59_28]PIX44299.1 MAG: hypothetical protein COZ56_04930 [Armatimonadetes bacterium CG_4_8_14_3_um_filter_58_9]PIY49024.1 MAG: hypothetical protein COZ05_01565 [Armatimonadetes bacterium CG_4_10_14_3_um_filter_59_10]PJB62019.1 MAG: hypothetical pr
MHRRLQNQGDRDGTRSAPWGVLFLALFTPTQARHAGAQDNPPAPGQQPPKLHNVALRAPFQSSSPGDANWKGLVDGTRDADVAPESYRSGNDAAFPKDIVIDLGGIYPVRQIVIRNSFNGNTKTVVVYYGASRTKWSEGWKFVFPQQLLRDFTYTLPDKLARYIKLEFVDTHGGGFEGNNIMYLREVEVLSASNEPVSLVTDEQRTRATEVARSLRMVHHFTASRPVPPRVAVLGDAVAAAAADVSGLCDLLGKELKTPAGSSATGTRSILPGEKLGRMEYWSTNLDGLTDLKEAEIVFLCFGWEDLSLGRNEFGFQFRKLIHSLKEITPAAIVGIIPPFPPGKGDAGKPAETASVGEIASVIKQVLDREECSLLDLRALSAKVDEVLGIFDSDGRLSAEGHAFAAAEMYRMVVPAVAGK